MVSKVLIGVLVVAAVFLVYTLFMSKADANTVGLGSSADLKKNRAAWDQRVVATGDVRAIEQHFNTGPGHF